MSDTAQAGAPALPAISSSHDRSFIQYSMGLDPDFEKPLFKRAAIPTMPMIAAG
jgi:hypothetical protein